jgi:hypothetical protein
MLNGQGVPLHVPQVGQHDPAGMVRDELLRAAGTRTGGRVVVECAAGKLKLSEVNILIAWIPPSLSVLSVQGTDVDTQEPVVIPWGAVYALREFVPSVLGA